MISALLVKELREKSGAGMMDAKKALLETDGDLEAAQDWLRTKGLLKAEKKSSRVAADGLVGVRVHENEGMMIELNSETDFVATNKEFIDLVDLILDQGFGITDKDKLLNKSVSGKNIQEIINNKIATIGENISLRRIISIKGSNIYSYLHNSVSMDCGKIGVLVSLEGNNDNDFGKKLAMHIAAQAPIAIDEKGINKEILHKELEIIKEELKNSGKKSEMIEKISKGKIKKFISDNTLLNQIWIMDTKKKVSQIIKEYSDGSEIKVLDFVRYKVGEGID